MSLIGKLFGSSNENNEIARIRKIIEKFIEASFLGLAHLDNKNPNQGEITLLYMFGAIDMLCQVNGLDNNVTLDLFKSMLKDELGEYGDEEAQVLLNEIIQATSEEDGQELMREGGEALRTWLSGEDAAAPHRLTEILMERNP